MAELKDIKATVHPTDTLLVVDAMTGQEAATLVKSFNDQVSESERVRGSDGRVRLIGMSERVRVIWQGRGCMIEEGRPHQPAGMAK